MQDFINGFLKAWKAWSDDGKDAFLESFLDEVKSSQNDPSNFLGILEQEIKSLSQEGLQDDMSSMLEVIESMKNEISKTLRDDNTKQGLDDENLELLESLQIIRDETNEVANSLRANETIELLRPTGENTTSKIASLALEENNKLNEKETNTQEQNTEKEQEKPKIGNDIDFKDKYANLHSFFKQTELDIKQKRIKTKLDFKESFLNYAKNHMNEDELKVLLVVSQKEPTKLTKEHINLIKDCLEQAHGNKHMQDKGLQLSVKSILGHELEKEHHEALKDYMQKSKDSLEPMDNRVYEVMQKHLDKQQEKALKNLDSTTQSVGVNAIKEQNKANENAQQETKNSQAQETTISQAYESVSQANTQDTTQANESIKPQTNNTATQQENTKESQVTQQNSTIQAQKEPHAKEKPKKVSHPDEPWLDYDPKNHVGLKELQENQEKTPSKGNDEPWIEHGKRMQEKAKAHYQACLEKERTKQNQQNTQNTIENQNKEVPAIDYGYTQNTLSKSRRR
ncbi:hypothetical protein EC514_07660 [Helicobacter pylori]|uniref:hypothetical protein n=1 Tax=Helicobacter pylori TaxID=210 RepID=UPI000FDEE1F0|nr:hypothetical protein [Helicobacter pylori]RVZ04190.1 hypothetical protein EC514_07660 [Helicobacter pylori]